MSKRILPTPTEFHEELLSKCGLALDYKPASYSIFHYQPGLRGNIIVEWLRSEEGQEWLIGKLREYCHQKGCKASHECPNGHANCRRILGLDTAIAWKAASYYASSDLHSLDALYEAVRLHLRKYAYLAQLLVLTMTSCIIEEEE